jgi:hypothetical protein
MEAGCQFVTAVCDRPECTLLVTEMVKDAINEWNQKRQWVVVIEDGDHEDQIVGSSEASENGDVGHRGIKRGRSPSPPSPPPPSPSSTLSDDDLIFPRSPSPKRRRIVSPVA